AAAARAPRAPDASRRAEPAAAARKPEERRDDGRRGRGRGRGRGREREETKDAAPAAEAKPAAAKPAADKRPATLSLARAFQLMTEALSEFNAPVSGEQLRGRMAALHGRDDPLLESSRFA